MVQDLGTAVARLILPCLAPTQQPHNSSPPTSIMDVAANKLSCILHPLPESAGILPPYEHLELPNLDRDFCISYQFGGGREAATIIVGQHDAIYGAITLPPSNTNNVLLLQFEPKPSFVHD